MKLKDCELFKCSKESESKMSVTRPNGKSEGGSFICIVCKSIKLDVHLLEGKKCTEEDFVGKFIKLVTKQFYENLCDGFKSHNNKTYVCRSCFMIILNTYDNIVRLQTGVAQSIKKRLLALQSKSQEKARIIHVDFLPLDIRRRKASGRQNRTKKEVGKHGIESLKLICINNKYPKIVLQNIILNTNNSDMELMNLDIGFEDKNIPGNALFIKQTTLLNHSVISNKGENVISPTLFKDKMDQSEKKLNLESLIVAARVVEADQATSNNIDPFRVQDRNLFIQNMNEKPKRMYHMNKPGPLSWKKRKNRSILPDNIDKLDPVQVKNLIVKTCTPIDLARVKDNNIYMCTEPNCGWGFLSVFSLNNHTKYFHYNGKPHKCPFDECSKAFAQKSKLKEHIKSHVGDKPFVCSTCGKGFSQSVNLKHHMITHTDKADVKDYKCPRPGCNQSYKYPHTLKRHLEYHDGGELPFPCTYPECKKAYKSKYELKCHYRHHTGEKPYKCDEPGCGKSFRLPGQFTIHRRNHRGERPFKCSWEGCDAAYSCRGQLENHILSHKGKTFICDTCGKTFTYKVAMLVHRKKMHTDELDYVCQVDGCDKAFHFRFALNAHVTKVHNAKHIDKKRRVARGSKKLFLLYPCPVQGCSKEYAAKVNIEKHLAQVHRLFDAKVEPKTRSDLLICPVDGCGSQFLTERNLRYHKVSTHNPLSVRFKKVYGGKRFSCTFEGCYRIYETMSAMREHIARVHTSVPREKMCFVCGAAFRHIQQLEIHRNIMHGEESVLNEHKVGIYICKAEKCGIKFFNADDLKQHVHIHMENPPYKCHYTGCRRAFLTEKNYNNHLLIHDDKKPYECNYLGCGDKFGTPFQLLKHSINHYGNFKCPIEGCERMLASLNSARVHLFRHTGEKPYVCSVCGMRFAVSSNWMRHTRTHTGEKPFECKICLKRFADKAVLTIHIRRHTGEKPYICKMCGSCFSSLSSIKIHMRLHTGESPYVCTEEGCDKRFRDISGLKSHKNVHTKASHLCSQCGKVYKWGIKKHKCKIQSQTAATDKKSKQVHHHHQQQLLKQGPSQQQQEQVHKQNILQQRQELQLQPLPVLLPQQQQQQQQQHQQPLQLSHQTPLQLQQTQSLPQLHTQVPEHSHQTQIHLTSIIHQQNQNSMQQQQQQQQQQQHSLTLLQALQQPLQMHEPQQLQHQVQQASLQHPHSQQAITQTPYVMGNMVMMQEQLHPGLSYVLDNNAESSRTMKPDGVTSGDPLVMHDLDSNYMIVYDRK